MRGRRSIVLALAALLVSLIAATVVWAKFSAQTANAGSTITAAADFRAPKTSARTVGKAQGGKAGYIKQGGTYNVYANATDTGNPASGISSVTVNASSFDTGVTATALAAGSFTFDAIGYNRATATLTANTPLAAGTYSYSLTLTDSAGNTATESGYTVTVDNTAPTATGVQTANGGSIAGRPEQNDTVTLTFSEPPEPNSILSGWTGASTGVTVRIDNNTAPSGNDQLSIYDAANTTQLPLGTIDLGRTDYVRRARTFGASGTASAMVLSASTITVTLGTQSGNGRTAAATGTMVWSPSATATDWAANAMSTATTTESGTADKEF